MKMPLSWNYTAEEFSQAEVYGRSKESRRLRRKGRSLMSAAILTEFLREFGRR